MENQQVPELLSVVTVTLNDVGGLRMTYESLCKQSYRNFQWVVQDGGSSDGTPAYLAGLKDKRVAWLSGQDKGIYDAMNKAVARADGTYVLFLNSGDVLSSHTVLETVAAKLVRDPEIDVLYGGANLVMPSGRSYYRAPRAAERTIWHGVPANHQATYFRRKLLLAFPYDLRYRICGDYYVAAKFFLAGAKAEYLDMPLVDFMVGGTSYKNRKKMFLEPYAIQRDILHLNPLVRWASLARRLIALVGLVLLSQKWSFRGTG